MIVHALAFYMFAAVAVAAGVMVISARNPVHSVLFLILAFFNAAGLFVLNMVAVLSLAEIAPAALVLHQLWGALLLLVWVWGPGALSLDRALPINRSVGT